MGDTAPLPCRASSTEQNAMMSSLSSSSQAAERLRVQELLRYFQPSSLAVDKEKPRVALDTSLTAYAQLSALKLDCQRSFISLIDHEKQYIIAEATRSVSLDTGETDGGPDDAIYLGTTTLDIHWGICPNTISVFTSTDGSLNITTPFVKADKSYYIMNDLSKVPGYESRPYITGWPHMRYYAEVPIHSPSGLVIGSLCVVDNKPREGLDIRGIEALKEISHTVMDHLELVMSKVQRKRAERMIQGLGLFVEGSDSLREWWIDSEKSSRPVDPSTRRLTIIEQADKEFGPRGSQQVSSLNIANVKLEKESKGIGSADSYDIDGSNTTPIFSSSADPLEILSTSPETESIPTEFPGWSTSSEGRVTESISKITTNGSMRKRSTTQDSLGTRSASTNSSGQMQLKLWSELELMLARAANLIREAVGLSGVSFFDAPIGIGRFSKYSHTWGRMEDEKTADRTMVTNGRDGHDKTFPNADKLTNAFATSSRVPKEKICKVWASSNRVGSDVAQSSAYSLVLPERMLHGMVERFPQGAVLEYDDKGPVSHGELELAWYQNIPKTREFSISGKDSQTSQEIDSEEANFLWRMLPGVRSIILFPLWDSSHDRLFAYNIAWTTDPNRVFQREDFAYLASFCNSITSEVSRLDTLAADRAKGNFISSISHELRSPLHGVLASAELLKLVTKDSTSIDIINTIETCGSTLLDTMENLLTFAKINDVTVAQQQKNSTGKLPSWEQSSPQPVKSLPSEVDLRILMEEVMNTNISGHQFRKSLEVRPSQDVHPTAINGNLTNPEDSVTVICDTDSQVNWIFATQAGAWKRIVMNLLGNSLKYTDAGFIHVKLSQEEHMIASHESPSSLICLSVEDSGKGMSEEYMKHHLFTPFQQEDPLCPGTGLGLSIVQQLVASINGTIEIQSEVGYGTRVEVKVVLEPRPETGSAVSGQETCREALSRSGARKVGLVAFDLYPDIQETPTGILSQKARRSLAIKSSVARAIENGFGLETVTVAALDSDFEDVDILITTESHLWRSQSATIRQRALPLIVLCSNLILDYRSVSDVNGPVIYLSQPFGPCKLTRALESCIPYKNPKAALKSILSRPLSMHTALNHDLKDFRRDLVNSPLSPSIPIESSSEKATVRKDCPQALLVEDNPINLKLLVTFLEKLGYPYATATDGLQAVEVYESARGKFDIIFMDIQMPIMDGMVASYEIRKFEQQHSLSRTPIIALTGLASADAQEQAMLSGVDLFLTKPVPLKKLKAVLEDHFPSYGGEGGSKPCPNK